MDPNSRLQHRHREDLSAESQQEVHSRSEPLEFATPEELIRLDREKTPLPAGIEQRLGASLPGAPASPQKPWWKRWWGTGDGE